MENEESNMIPQYIYKSNNKNRIAKRFLIMSIIIKAIGCILAVIVFLAGSFSFLYNPNFVNGTDYEITDVLYRVLFSVIKGFAIILITFFITLPLDAKAEILNLLQDIKNNTADIKDNTEC